VGEGGEHVGVGVGDRFAGDGHASSVSESYRLRDGCESDSFHLRHPDEQEGEDMAVQDVIVVSVPVSDQHRAKAFYVDQLGFELVREDDSVPGIRWSRWRPREPAPR
jgi:hypothetical protein